MFELFDGGLATAEQSVTYYFEHKHLFTKFTMAIGRNFTVTDGKLSTDYKVVLQDCRGNRMYLSGISAIDNPIRAKGLEDILIDAGFEININRINVNGEFTFYNK